MGETSQKKQAWITSLRLLAASSKSGHELARRLDEKGYPKDVIAGTLAELEKKGLLNDRTYADQLVAKNVLGRPAGMRKIAFELKRHGIPPKIQEELLARLTPESEAERARELAGRQWERCKPLPLRNRKEKVYDFLIRRGFDFQTAREVVDQLPGEGGAGEDLEDAPS